MGRAVSQVAPPLVVRENHVGPRKAAVFSGESPRVRSLGNTNRSQTRVNLLRVVLVGGDRLLVVEDGWIRVALQGDRGVSIREAPLPAGDLLTRTALSRFLVSLKDSEI